MDFNILARLLSSISLLLFSSGILLARDPVQDRSYEPSNPNLGKFIEENIGQIRIECTDRRDEIVSLRGVTILCYHGIIYKTSSITEYKRKYSIVYLNSPGGDIAHSFVLGREIFGNGAYALIDEQCHSACGSYLIPSPKRIYIADKTVMSMHTSTPRTAKDFIFMRYPKEVKDLKENIRSSSGILNETDSIVALISEYDRFFQDFVMEEMKYFNYIARDVAFSQRYREVFRTLSRRDPYGCGPQAGLHLIIGPKYLEEFDIRVIRAWFPTDRAEFVALLPNASKTDALIYDFDDHPFWIPGKGLVSSQYCMGSE